MRAVRSTLLRVVLAALLAAAPALAQTGPELMLKPFPKELAIDLNADGYVTDQGHAKGTDQSLRVGIVDVAGRVRLSPGDLTSPRVGFEFKYFDVDSDVPGLPARLYDQNVGFAMPLGKYQDWILGASGGVGYAGQAPFGDGNAWYGRASLMAFKQIDDTSFLAVGIDYDGNRTFRPDLPLPGFAYSKRIQDNLTLTVGLPVTSIEWEPVKNLRVELSYLLTDNFAARVGYEVGGGVEVFGSVGQRSDAFFVEGGRHGDDRLLFQQRRAEAGVTYRTRNAGVGDRDVELTAAVGYAFNGEFSVGFDTRDSYLVADVSDEPYVRVGVQVRF